mmetsp:Transcript_31108/g.92637  ORF Transcript_31108/g.92637 Transcript_31108/m.92637 type:complete len:845 (-) Transcript_31108:23-2557(-)
MGNVSAKLASSSCKPKTAKVVRPAPSQSTQAMGATSSVEVENPKALSADAIGQVPDNRSGSTVGLHHVSLSEDVDGRRQHDAGTACVAPPPLHDQQRNSTGSLGAGSHRSGDSQRSSFTADTPASGACVQDATSAEGLRVPARHNRGMALRASSFEASRAGGAAAVGSTGGSSSGRALQPVPELELPLELSSALKQLMVLQDDTPAPVTVLQRIWGLGKSEAEARLEELRARDVVHTAQLPDGSVWATLPQADGERLLLISDQELISQHRDLIDSYSAECKGQLHSVPDDGYVWKHLVYHLINAERVGEIGALLTHPAWLEAKLHAYGMADVVADFRRYLAVREDADVKVVLQAFMLSATACTAFPGVPMMRPQLLGRLMAFGQLETASQWLKDWLEMQMAAAAAEEHLTAGHRCLTHLLPRSASLQQAGGVLRNTLRGHSAPVRRVVISPNGRDVVTVSEDGSVQVWDMNVGDCVMKLSRESPLTDVSVAPDGGLCVIGSADGTCCLWDLTTGQIKHVLTGHTTQVNAVAVDRQGIRCVTASDDGTVRVWDIATGACEQVLQGHNDELGAQGVVFDVAISSDGSLAALVSNDFSCRVFDLDEERCLHVLQGHGNWVVSVEFIGTTEDVVTASHDSTARVWDTARGKCTHVLSGHSGRLNKVTVNSAGTHGITCSDDLTAKVWDLDTGACLSTLVGHAAWISAACMTSDKRHVVTVSGDATGFVWDVKSGNRLMELEGHTDAIRSVVTTYHGRFAVTASDDGTARVWDLQAPVLPRVPKHDGRVKQLKALPDSRRVISIGDDGLAMVWDGALGVVDASVDAHTAVVQYIGLSRDGSIAATGACT